MKKILIVSNSFLPRWDGVTRFLTEVIPRLKESFNISIIAPDFKGSNEIIMDGVEIVRLPLSRFVVNDYPLAKFSKKISHYVQNSDLVWTQDISPLSMSAAYYAKKHGRILISFNHVIEWEIIPLAVPFQFFLSTFIKMFSVWFYNRFDMMLIPNVEMKEYYETLGVKTFSKVVPLGVNTDKFVPPIDKFQAKQRIGIDPGYFVIGYCGRLSREKDILTLFKAFETVQNKYVKIKLLLVGRGVKELEDFLHEKHNVIVTGEVDNVVPYLQAMDIFVVSSLTETTGLAALEAMSCSVPVISTPEGALKTILDNKNNGLLFPKKNVLVLRKKIQLLINDESFRKAMAIKARETILNKYSWSYTNSAIKESFSRFQ